MDKNVANSPNPKVVAMAMSGKMVFLCLMLTFTFVADFSNTIHSAGVLKIIYNINALILSFLLFLGGLKVCLNASPAGVVIMRVAIIIKLVFSIIIVSIIGIITIIFFIILSEYSTDAKYIVLLLSSLVIIYYIYVCRYYKKLSNLLGNAAFCLQTNAPIYARISRLAGISMLFFVLSLISMFITIASSGSSLISDAFYDLPYNMRAEMNDVYYAASFLFDSSSTSRLYSILIAPLKPITYFLVFSFARNYR